MNDTFDQYRKKLIVALDVDDLSHAQTLVRQLRSSVGLFKVGHQLFSCYGPKAVEMIHGQGGAVFLDLKYHDIPNTVKLAVEAATALQVAMVNVHASGGKKMMTEAANAARAVAEENGIPKPIMLGVTVLTSLSESDLVDVGMNGSVVERVERLALLAHEAGLDGVVASPQELVRLREVLPRDFVIVTPGVRFSAAPGDDQKRTLTPRQAIEAGSDYLVVGRPIVKAPDPVQAAQAIVRDMIGE